MNPTGYQMPPWGWPLVALLLFSQALWMFRDAQRRGARAWLWGLYGLTSVPSALLVYYFAVIFRQKRRKSGRGE